MPKRKRSRNRKPRKVAAVASSVVKETVSSSELSDEESDDLEFLQDSLAEGRAKFLSKMTL